jgi:hypothetical protein
VQKHEWYSDTDPKALEVFLALQRSMTATEKIEAVLQQNELLRSLTEARERQLCPEATDREIFLRKCMAGIRTTRFNEHR